MPAKAVRFGVVVAALVSGLLGILLLSSNGQAQSVCDAPANEIVAENCRPGSPKSEWDVSGAGSPGIQGFADEFSLNAGDTQRFKVKTDASDYRLDIYRMGYYGGDGARRVATVQPSASLPQSQPECSNEASTGLVDCGNWGVSAAWQVPADAVSGIYFAKLVREDGTPGSSHVMFIVRDDDGNSDLLFQTADTTWQAYNQYGGNSLYTGQPAGRAYKVSYNRPFTTRSHSDEDWVFNSEYPMVRWIERNGYDVSYFTGIDGDRLGAEIRDHKAFLSVGHDEYWSGAQRDNVEAARDAGVDLAFFSGNEVFWKTRWEDSHDTLVSYKETHAGAKIDPSPEWTGTWRDNRSFNPEGPRPENALTGTIFTVNCCTYSMKVPAADGKMRLWRDTSVANLAPDATATLPDGTLGYEWDEDLDNGSRPAGLVRMSSTTVDVPQRIQDNGSNYAPGTATHALTLYKDDNPAPAQDALVFGAGTVQWSWGLDGDHDRSGGAPDARMQQATVNLFADMGVQPGTLQGDLAAATASSDTTAPTSQVTSPTDGGTVEEDTPVTITGTASDAEGGVVGGVEVSVDNGETWKRAEGRENWRYTWTPGSQGTATIKTRAADDSGNLGAASEGVDVTVGPQAPASCPCTIWDDSATPPLTNDAQAYELGTKFRSDVAGFVTGVRFYKGPNNTGTHVGHLWRASTGEQLAEATFTQETASGWQEVRFSSPVAIEADTTYVASYHTNTGNYAFSGNYFASTGVDNPPLRALRSGVDGGNGVFHQGGIGFPNQTFNSSNYWVDVVFETSTGPDATPPTVRTTSPAGGATGVGTGTTVNATFSEALDAATVGSDTFELRDASGNAVPADVAYNASSKTATLTPRSALANSAEYTARIKGGSGGVKDAAGNALAEDRTWTFATAAPPPPPPDEGPGGPVLVVGSAGNPFGRFYAEILRNEGLNAFNATDISSVSASTLDGYDTVILGEMPLGDAQVSMFGDWVNGGGNLISMRPDPKLAGLLGLADTTGTLADAYLKVDTSSAPGRGIVGETIQFHGTADRYTLDGARAVATLHSDASQQTPNPAVTLRDVGTNGGQAAAFTYDLARSVVYTRQGNPAWAGDERDGQSGPIRSDDLFYGAKAGDVQSDWVDLNKVAIPQADEQQRLLANLIELVNRDKKPLPRFWYFPRGEQAVVIMTGDDHGNGGTAGQFDNFKAASPAGCSVADWECIRGSSYIYTNTPLSAAQAKAYEDEGFEVALHVSTNCANFTPQSLAANYTDQLAAWRAKYASLAAPTTNRTHCIAWSDWATQPKVELENGIRLDTNYYYWPESWIQDRPGMFTGSGMPMRFAETDGTMIDVYQATTQMTDESGQEYPATANALLDKAIGPEGFYGAFTTNMHTDSPNHAGANAIVASAKARGVPVVSARQMLEWLDGRNASSFENLNWMGNKLTFSIDAGAGSNGLQAMLPIESGSGDLAGLTRAGGAVDYATKTIKGIEYAVFSANAGQYEASYEADTAAPQISGLSATANSSGTATVTWTTDEPATSRVDYGTSPGSLNLNATEPGSTTSHSVTLTGLEPATTYHFRATSEDAAGNAATSPPGNQAPASFETPEAGFTDTTSADFGGGTPGNGAYISQTDDGELTLLPAAGAEFSGTSLPAGWTGTPWGSGGTATVGDGRLTVDGARAGTDALFGPGRSLEFVATFGGAPFQHVGFGTDYNGSPWANFSTGGGSLPLGLYAKSWAGGAQSNTPVTGVDPGQPHRYRIEWQASEIVYYVDGTEVARHQVSITDQMRPLASDFNVGGPAITVDWLRMSPYEASGTFQSRAFDSSKSATDWLKLLPTTRTPAGTNVTFETRSGNTATPDASWSGWQPVGAGGTIASPDGRYVQYRANLSTTAPQATPTVEQVTLASGAGGPDTTPPGISSVTATPGSGGTASVGWTTDEPSDSRVDYGTSPGSLTLNKTDAQRVTSHGIELTGLKAGTTYYYRVTSADEAGNAATSPRASDPPSSFDVPSASLTDDTAADFGAGTPGADAYVSQTGNGEVMLRPAVGEEFFGAGLPAGWFSSPWGFFTPGSAGAAGGELTVNGACAGTGTSTGSNCQSTGGLYGPGRSLEFVATFAGAKFQHIGLGVDYNNSGDWAMFSTKSGGGLYARTNSGGPETQLSSALLDAPHRYRIEWRASEIVYYVDGAEVARHAVAITGQMRPLASDIDAGDAPITIDWLRMSPHPGAATLQSRVFDAGKSADWLELVSSTGTPAGTNVSFETRSGSTAEPDGGWTGWQAVGAGGAIAGPDNRYIQYRMELSTSDPEISPVVERVTLGYRLDEEPPGAPSTPDLTSQSDTGVSDADDLTRNTTPTFTGTAEAGSTVKIFVDGVEKGSGTATGGDYSITTSELQPGVRSVTARASDAAGNLGAESEALGVTIDTEAPDTTITDGPSGTVNSNTATFRFGSDPGATFECKLDAASYAVCVSPKTYADLSDGAHAFSVRARDAAGNEDGSAAERNFTVDATAPPAPEITAPANNSFDNTGNITVSGTAEEGVTVELFEGTASRGTASVGAGGAWSIRLANVPDGEHTYTARATDSSGNTSAASGAVKVTVDTGSPSVSGVSPERGASNVSVGANIRATFSEEMRPGTINAGTFKLTEQGGTTEVAATVGYDAATRTATLDPSSDLGPGKSYTATVTTGATDRAGNALAGAESWTFSTADPVDATPPTVVGTVPAAGETGVAPSANVRATFSEAMDPSTITGANVRLALRSGGRVAGTVGYDAATRTATLDPNANLADNTVYRATITVGVKDLAGNAMTAPRVWTFTTANGSDTTPPAPPTVDLTAARDTGSSNTDDLTNDSTPTFVGKAEAGSEVSVFDGATLLGRVTAAGTGDWTFTVGGAQALSDGAHQITARARDANGNQSDPSGTLRIVVDTAAPDAEPPAATVAEGSRLATSTVPVKISWSADDENGVASYGVQQRTDDGAFASVRTALTETSITRSLDPNRSYTFRVNGTDRAGNTSGWAEASPFRLVANQETDASIVYGGTWSNQSVSGAYGGALRFASAAGNKATYTFTGDHVAWIATTGPGRGLAEVWLDGEKVKTVDLYSPANASRTVVFSQALPDSGNHELEIRVLGTRNPASSGTRVDLDAFITLR